MRHAAVWVLLLVVGIILIVAGWRGRVGSVMGAIITPSQLQDLTTPANSGGWSGGYDGNGNPIPVNGACPPGYHLLGNQCVVLLEG